MTKSCNYFPFNAFKRFVIESLSAVAPTSFKSFVISSAAIFKSKSEIVPRGGFHVIMGYVAGGRGVMLTWGLVSGENQQCISS